MPTPEATRVLAIQLCLLSKSAADGRWRVDMGSPDGKRSTCVDAGHRASLCDVGHHLDAWLCSAGRSTSCSHTSGESMPRPLGTGLASLGDHVALFDSSLCGGNGEGSGSIPLLIDHRARAPQRVVTRPIRGMRLPRASRAPGRQEAPRPAAGSA